MKKKFLAILSVLIICLSPVFFLVGCKEEKNNDVIVTVGDTWTVKQNQSFSSITEPDEFEIKYHIKKYNPEAGKYQYLTKDKKTFSNEKPAESDMPFVTTLAEAIKEGLMVVSGFDSSKIETGKKMTLIFSGVQFDVTYDVVANS